MHLKVCAHGPGFGREETAMPVNAPSNRRSLRHVPACAARASPHTSPRGRVHRGQNVLRQSRCLPHMTPYGRPITPAFPDLEPLNGRTGAPGGAESGPEAAVGALGRCAGVAAGLCAPGPAVGYPGRTRARPASLTGTLVSAHPPDPTPCEHAATGVPPTLRV